MLSAFPTSQYFMTRLPKLSGAFWGFLSCVLLKLPTLSAGTGPPTEEAQKPLGKHLRNQNTALCSVSSTGMLSLTLVRAEARRTRVRMANSLSYDARVLEDSVGSLLEVSHQHSMLHTSM